jgi:hypothetical protein
MDFRALKARIGLLAARLECAAKVRPLVLTIWEKIGGRAPVRLPDWPLHAETQALRPPMLGVRGRRPVGERSLAGIRVIIVDRESASPEGHSITAFEPDEDAT